MTTLLLLLSITGCMVISHSCNDSIPRHADSKRLHRAEWLSALQQAAAENRQDVMMALLQNGNTVNSRATNELHTAAARGDISAVKFILGKGINLELPDNYGLTALHLAAINNHHDAMGVLLAEGADVNARASDGSTLLHLAVANDMMGSVEFILQSENVLLSPKNNDLFTPLVLAERLGHVEIASLLRKKIGNISVSTLFSTAYRNSSVEEVRSLVLRGADVNGQISGGWAPLHTAAGAHKNFDTVKFLVEHGAEVNIKTSDGRTPLFEAAWWGNLDEAKYLVENFAEINAIGEGITPTRAASQQNHTDVAEYLKSKGGET